MIFEKETTNGMGIYDEDVYFEIEKDVESDPIQGISITAVSKQKESCILNITLSHEDILKLYSGLTKYICEAKEQICE